MFTLFPNFSQEGRKSLAFKPNDNYRAVNNQENGEINETIPGNFSDQDFPDIFANNHDISAAGRRSILAGFKPT